MENRSLSFEGDHLNFKATELRLGLPGSQEPEKQRRTVAKNNKRVSLEMAYEECRSNSNSKSNSFNTRNDEQEDAPPTKTQVVGWPPIRSYRKNSMQPKKDNEAESGGVYVKVSVDGVPYLRKIDLMFYKSYLEFLKALENLFKLTIGKYSETESYGTSDYAPTYEDKDGDWMLVGDVPWDMFVSSCKRLRIMTGSGAIGLTCE